MSGICADAAGCSLDELLELALNWARLGLLSSFEGVLASSLACHAAKDHTVLQQVATHTVIAMDAASRLASHIEAWDHLAFLVKHLCAS